MGGWVFPTYVIIQVAVQAIRIDDHGSNFPIAAQAQHHQQQTNQEIPTNINNLQSSSFYSFQANNNDGSHVDLDPYFNYQIYHPDHYQNVDTGGETQVVPSNNIEHAEEYAAQQREMKDHFLSSENSQQMYSRAPQVFPEVSLPKNVPSNSHFLSYTVESPTSKVSSYYSAPEVRKHKKYTTKSQDSVNMAAITQQEFAPRKYVQLKYVPIPSHYTLADISSKAEKTYKKLSDVDDTVTTYKPQAPSDYSKLNYRQNNNRINLQQAFSGHMRDLIAKAHYLDLENQRKVKQKDVINRKDSTFQPSQQYENYEEHSYGGDIHDGGGDAVYDSYHHEEKKKKKEIHYHQHKHLHEHDHDQKHTHKHQAGHHHDHGHDHKQDHHHSHDHKDDHWHDHHEKNNHHHESDHSHGHHASHDHKHDEDHGHKHKHDQYHGHESHHDHHEDHKNKHDHKHHSDHGHHHDHDHKHSGKHGHDHHESHKHGHKHSHKHKGKH